MKVEVKDSGKCRKTVYVEAPSDIVLSEYDKLLKEYRSLASVPGFRKGKAPAEAVERKYGKKILEDTKERLLPELYRKALEQEEIKPVAVLKVENDKIDKSEGMSFEFTVDVPPEFKLPKYKKIGLKRQKTDVEDKEVDDAIYRIRENMARYEESQKEPASSGDMLKIDYKGTIDGQPASEKCGDCSELGSGTDFWVILNEREFLPGFSAELEGMAASDRKTVHVSFPQDYHVQQVAGMEADYDVEVKSVRKRRLPELDEEFFKSAGVESIESLREKLLGQLKDAKERDENGRLKNEIAEYLLGKTEMDVPSSLVEQEKKTYINNLIQRMVKQGVSQEQFEGKRDEILAGAEKSSVDRVKLMYILSKIADEEGIEVTDAQFEAWLESMAAGYGMEPPQLKAELQKKNSVEGVRSDIRQDNTLGHLLEQAKIK